MHNRPQLSAEEVNTLLAAALAHARGEGWKVCVAVVDDGGHLLALQRDDGAAPATAHIAIAKARTAAMARRESKYYEEMLASGRLAFLSAPGVDCLLEGGVPLMVDGTCAAGVGVSGVQSQQDAEIARAGIAAVLAA